MMEENECSIRSAQCSKNQKYMEQEYVLALQLKWILAEFDLLLWIVPVFGK